MIDNNDKAYLAGLFDGEGCFSITLADRHNASTKEWKVVAIITQSERKKNVLEKYKKITGLGSITKRPSKKPDGKVSPYKIYQWRINSKHIDFFIDLIYEFLEVKQQQADIVRKFRATFSKQGGLTGSSRLNPTTAYIREECRLALHRLNDHSHVTLTTPHVFQNNEVEQLKLML